MDAGWMSLTLPLYFSHLTLLPRSLYRIILYCYDVSGISLVIAPLTSVKPSTYGLDSILVDIDSPTISLCFLKHTSHYSCALWSIPTDDFPFPPAIASLRGYVSFRTTICFYTFFHSESAMPLGLQFQTWKSWSQMPGISALYYHTHTPSTQLSNRIIHLLPHTT